MISKEIEDKIEKYVKTLGGLGNDSDENTSKQLIIWGYLEALKDNKEKKYTTEDIETAYRQGNFDGNSMARMLHREIPSFNSSKEYIDSLKNK